MVDLFQDAFLYAPPLPRTGSFHWASRLPSPPPVDRPIPPPLEGGGGEEPGEGRQPGEARVDDLRPAAQLPGDVRNLRRAVAAGEGLPDLLVQSHGLQNLAFARARPASAASCSSASASASTSASASASASEFEKGLHAVIDDIIKDAVTKGYHYPAEPLCRSRNLEAIKRRAALPTRRAILLVGEGMNRAHHDLLDEQCPSGRAMNKVID